MNPRDSLLNTDYPIDKIVGYTSGSFNLTSGSPTITYPVPHIFNYSPLFFLKWSLTPDFSVSYDEIGVTFNSVFLGANGDASNTYIFAGMNTPVNTTVYYRIIYFMPTNVDEATEQTQSGLDTYILNTDYNYTKIFDENYIPSSSGIVEHGLGYYPQVEAWYIRASDGRLVHLVANDVTSSVNPRVVVTPTNVSFLNGSTIAVSGWHYKIYVDEV